MLLSVNAQVSLLLTTRFSDRDDTDVLTAKQWAMLCTCLGGVEKLAELLDGRHVERLRECGITSELSEKVSQLLSRGVGLAMASEKWLRTGVWILGAGDAEYPQGIRDLGVEEAPPVLFGYGSIEMLEQTSVAIPQSGCRTDAVEFSKRVDSLGAAVVGLLDVTYGRDVILSTLRLGGQAIGVTYKDLVAYGSAEELRQGVLSGMLTLISSCPPGQDKSLGPVYEESIVAGLADNELSEHVLGQMAKEKPEDEAPPAQQLDFDF